MSSTAASLTLFLARFQGRARWAVVVASAAIVALAFLLRLRVFGLSVVLVFLVVVFFFVGCVCGIILGRLLWMLRFIATDVTALLGATRSASRNRAAAQ
jgi:hypothetical protein